MPRKGDKVFTCTVPECSKTFSRHADWNRHLDAHFGISYHCEACNKGFARNDTLLRHKRVCKETKKIVPTHTEEDATILDVTPVIPVTLELKSEIPTTSSSKKLTSYKKVAWLETDAKSNMTRAVKLIKDKNIDFTPQKPRFREPEDKPKRSSQFDSKHKLPINQPTRLRTKLTPQAPADLCFRRKPTYMGAVHSSNVVNYKPTLEVSTTIRAPSPTQLGRNLDDVPVVRVSHPAPVAHQSTSTAAAGSRPEASINMDTVNDILDQMTCPRTVVSPIRSPPPQVRASRNQPDLLPLAQDPFFMDGLGQSPFCTEPGNYDVFADLFDPPTKVATGPITEHPLSPVSLDWDHEELLSTMEDILVESSHIAAPTSDSSPSTSNKDVLPDSRGTLRLPIPASPRIGVENAEGFDRTPDFVRDITQELCIIQAASQKLHLGHFTPELQKSLRYLRKITSKIRKQFKIQLI